MMYLGPIESCVKMSRALVELVLLAVSAVSREMCELRIRVRIWNHET